MLRLQFAGLVGNLVVAGPLSYGLALVFEHLTGHHWMTEAQAHHALAANSVLGPSLLYAALTGVFLWTSSLLGALGDNWVRIHRLADRLSTNLWVMTWLRGPRAERLSSAIVSRIGGMIGNASLGFLLGCVPAAFAIAHLPVEIRHITVSTASVSMALATGTGSPADVGLALGGLVVIALVNVVTSFTLALWLAFRATRGLRAVGSSNVLARIGMSRWISTRRPPASVRPTPGEHDRPTAAAA
jgi:site-specific recombinase